MSGLGKAISSFGDWLRELVGSIPGMGFLACLAAQVVGVCLEAWYQFLQAGTDHHLSDQTKQIMRSFFQTVDLDAVTIRPYCAIPGGHAAMTLMHRIYFHGGFDECDCDDMGTLLHELVHVRQFEAMGWSRFVGEYGRDWLDRGYGAMWMEREAERFRLDNKAELDGLVRTACAPMLV